MANMPPVSLGVTIFSGFIIAIVIRKAVEHRFVLSVPDSERPRKQLIMDLTICVAAGVIVSIYNLQIRHFPSSSAISLTLGFITTGFFMSLDTALDREHINISEAMAEGGSTRPPERLYSMTQKFSLMAGTTAIFVSAIIIMIISRDIIWISSLGSSPESLAMAQRSVTLEIIFIIAVLLILIANLIVSYSRNLKLLFKNETDVLEQVSLGDLSKNVPVATNDEFGLIAGYTNNMIRGLKHRIELISSLKLAEEVQQNLLPEKSPNLPDLDISGSSIYCDETGGDYYDYVPLPKKRLGVVVADAADHGVGSALYMATARAFLISSARDYTAPRHLLSRVNHFLTIDSAETGRFMTMFFLEIDTAMRRLQWAIAGHAPALMYDPADGSFSLLGGKGVALGVLENADYKNHRKAGWSPNSIIVISTDGVDETRNHSNDMFGSARVRKVIQTHADENAESIKKNLIEALSAFRGGASQEDDITLVVIKLP